MYVYANMYKQIGICFKHLRAAINPSAKFGISRVIAPVLYSVFYSVFAWDCSTRAKRTVKQSDTVLSIVPIELKELKKMNMQQF